MKKYVLLFAVCAATALAGCSSSDAAEEEVILRSVEVAEISTDSISSDFSYSGKAAAAKEVAVMPLIAGKVTGYNYDVGDNVKAGTVLFTVDSSTLHSQLLSAEANYSAAELGYNNAKKTFENNSLLFDEGIISQAEMDQINYAYESAGANLNALQIQINLLKKNIGDCSVTSPMNGVITARNIEIGGFATQAMPSFTVMDLSTIKVEVGVSEQGVNAIKPGDTVSVKMTGASAEPFIGTIATVSPATGATGTYSVKVELDNANGLIKSGMLAEVSFTTEQSDDAIVLASDTILSKDGETYVYLVDGQTVKKALITIGIESGESTEVLSGLAVGDFVITRGQTYVSDGEQVTISNAEEVGIVVPTTDEEEGE